MVEEEWQHLRDTAIDLPAEEYARIAAYFAPPEFAPLPARSQVFEAARRDHEDFDLWCRANVKAHKVDGYAIVNISLKPIGGIPGDATDAQMDAVAVLADDYSFSEIRIAHEQNLVLPHVRQDDVFAVWQALKAHQLATPNFGLLSDIIACPGLDYCALANARSIPIAQAISQRFADLERQHEIGPITLNISGCINACAHHHVGNIGILGVDKKGVEFYQITLGGRADEGAAIGEIVGPAFGAEEVPDAIETIIETYLAQRGEGETFVDTYTRVGLAPFKERLYATD